MQVSRIDRFNFQATRLADASMPGKQNGADMLADHWLRPRPAAGRWRLSPPRNLEKAHELVYALLKLRLLLPGKYRPQKGVNRG